MKAIVTVGISASGKSTWANNQEGFAVVCRDDARWTIMLEKNIEPCWENWKWKWEDEVTRRTEAAIRGHAADGVDIIVADTNLNPAHFEKLSNFLASLGYEVEIKAFNITWDEAVKRDNKRQNGVGYSVLQQQHQKFLDLAGCRVQQDPSLPLAAIVDIDGTVAKMEGHRGPFEWHKVDMDRPNEPVISMVYGLQRAGYKIIFTSGRDGSCRELTQEWLHSHVLAPWVFQTGGAELLMRAPGDMRKDTVVKEEIFRNHILGKYYVNVVLDDRPSVCRMWRDLGLDVVQVGNPYIEF